MSLRTCYSKLIMRPYCGKIKPTTWSYGTIQVLSYNSLVIARQNVPITSILTNCTLGSWKDFDVDFSVIGSKEMIWKTSYECIWLWNYVWNGIIVIRSEHNGCRRFSKFRCDRFHGKRDITKSKSGLHDRNCKQSGLLPRTCCYWHRTSREHIVIHGVCLHKPQDFIIQCIPRSTVHQWQWIPHLCLLLLGYQPRC